MIWSPTLENFNVTSTYFTFHFLIFIIIRATSHPIPRPSTSGCSQVLSPPVTSAGVWEMTSPWFLVYQVEEEDEDKLGEGLHVFFKWTNGYAISNLNQPNWTPQRFKHLSVSIVCSAIEQELRDQGEVVRLVVLDARGQPIMDSSHTRSKLLYSVYSFFVLRSYQVFVFRKKKP